MRAYCFICILAASVALLLILRRFPVRRVASGNPLLSAPNTAREYVSATIADRVEILEKINARFVRTGVLLAIATALAIRIALKDLQEYKIPVLDVGMPILWVKVFLPSVLLFVFMHWGFLLHLAVDFRAATWSMIDAEDRARGLSGGDLRGFSRKQLLRDNFFLDQWFMAFRPAMSSIDEGKGWLFNRLILISFALVVSTSHGAALMLISQLPSAAAPSYVWLAVPYGACCAILFLFSHCLFTYGGPQKNWICPIIMWGGVGTYAILAT